MIVIGLDGAGCHLLADWIEDGYLPNLSRLIEDGAWHRLRSSYPPVTSPAWRCYSTGVNPGKHGVFWWETLDREDHEISVPNANSYNAKSIWDYLGDVGLTSAVVNMPTTHPPEAIDGWMISGGGFTNGYTHPETLQHELESEIGYQNDLTIPNRNLQQHPEKIARTEQLINHRFAAAEFIRNRYDPDFIHLTLFVTNVIQHHLWDGEATKRMWKFVDRNIGDFLRDGDNVIVMSDHGANEIKSVFNVNTWLEQEGYLQTNRSAAGALHSLGITKERAIDITERLGVKWLARHLVPNAILRKLPEGQGGVGRDAKSSLIDWERSTAVASGQGPIYVLAEGNERDRIASEIVSRLESVTTPRGRPVARNVYRDVDVYEGPYVDDGPDVIIDQADGIHVPDVIGAPSVFIPRDGWKWLSENHRDGIFIAHGPDVTPAGKLSTQPTLYDLAPTILHWYGASVPTDLDGDVLTDIFRPDSDPGTRDVERSDVQVHKRPLDGRVGESDEMRSRLQDLGYISD